MVTFYNPLNCAGWTRAGTGYVEFGGACMKSKLGFVILFFLVAILKKWGGEEIGLSFNFIVSLIAGLGAYALIIFFTGSFKFAMLAGLIGAAAGGYLGGSIFGDSGDGGY